MNKKTGQRNDDREEVPSEEKLLKAMDELEAAAGLRKGDALQNNDTEGDFSTEGEKLSKEAKKSKKEKPDLSKKYSASDMDDEDEDEDDEDEDQDEGDEDEEDEKPMGKMGKSERPRPLSERAGEDPSMRKSVDASEFLESFVRNMDQLTEENRDYICQQIQKSDKRLAGFHVIQSSFNRDLVKSQVALGRGIAEMLKETKKNNELLAEQNSLLKSLGAQPMPNGKVGGNGDTRTRDPERGGKMPGEGDPLYPKKVADWLMEKALKNEISGDIASYYESNGYNFDLLKAHAPAVAKLCEKELREAAKS